MMLRLASNIWSSHRRERGEQEREKRKEKKKGRKRRKGGVRRISPARVG